MLICRYCKVLKLLSEFRERKDTVRYDSRCKVCLRQRSAFVKKIKPYAPPKPEFCMVPGCDRKAKCCDHDPEITDERYAFRGWICRECNTAIGLLGDTEERIKGLQSYIVEAKNRVRSI